MNRGALIAIVAAAASVISARGQDVIPPGGGVLPGGGLGLPAGDPNQPVATAAPAGLARAWRRELQIDASLAASHERLRGADADAGESQLIAAITPGLRLAGRGPNLELDLRAAATLLGTVGGSGGGRVLPEAHGSLVARPWPRLFRIESDLGVDQTEDDPYRGRVSENDPTNRRTAVSLGVAPIVEYSISPRWSVLAGHRWTMNRTSSGPTEQLQAQETVLRIDAAPLPLGGALEWSNLDIDNEGGTGDAELSIRALRARASLTFADGWIAGPVLGTERAQFDGVSRDEAIRGLHVQWIPGPRTRLVGVIERRFFGTGYQWSLTHRTPFLSLALEGERGPARDARGAGRALADRDLAAFLDAILTTRHPDAATRAPLVSDIIASRGLVTTLAQPSQVYAGYAQLATGWRAQAVWLGRRNTLSLSIYSQERRRLDDEAEGVTDDDSRQRGVGVAFNRRLTPQLSVDLAAQYTAIQGLGSRDGDRSTERRLRLNVSSQLSPRTTLSVGALYARVHSNVDDVESLDRIQLIGGLGHRF